VWTYLGRRPKRKGERELPSSEFTAALPFLKEEVAILRPPVIVLLGPNAIKAFFPDIKSVAEHIGNKSYSADLDATVIIGFNPTQLYFDNDKRAVLTDVFREAKKLVEYA
jgi:uracil-DNA glycosylase